MTVDASHRTLDKGMRVVPINDRQPEYRFRHFIGLELNYTGYVRSVHVHRVGDRLKAALQGVEHEAPRGSLRPTLPVSIKWQLAFWMLIKREHQPSLVIA